MASIAARAGDNRFGHITFDPEVMGGRACIRGMRVTVATIVDQIAEGSSIDELLADYPYLEREDVRQALAYAAWLARDEVVPAQGHTVRFLVDANLSPRVAEWLRDKGHDAAHVFEVGLNEAGDHRILEEAVSRRQILLTVDLDFGEILARSSGVQAY